MPVLQKIEYQMQRISVDLINGWDENQLNYNNDLPAIGKKIMQYRNLSKQIFWQ